MWRTTSWWRHQMETFSALLAICAGNSPIPALLAICAGNSPVPGELPTQRSVTRSFDVFFDLRLNKRLSKQSWGWWFETLSRPLWRHCNVESLFWRRCAVQLVIIFLQNTKLFFKLLTHHIVWMVAEMGIPCDFKFWCILQRYIQHHVTLDRNLTTI